MNQEDFFFNLIVDPVLESQAIQVEVEPGLVFVFDSHLWGCSGKNPSGCVWWAINQQIDHPVFLEDQPLIDLESKLAQCLGFFVVLLSKV